MREIDQILRLWRKSTEAGEAAVLATVVKTRGSSYRLPGARLLLTRSGQRAGSISGGCLEEELLKRAWWLTENGPIVRRYDTTPDGEIGSGFGLGCNGIIHVLLQRLYPGQRNVLDLTAAVRSERRPAAVAHLIHPPAAVGQQLVIDTSGSVEYDLALSVPPDLLEGEARAALAENCSRVIAFDQVEAFVETLSPAIRLLVFGAGDDVVPLTDMAKYLGWRVSVADGRSHYARRDKFPNADDVTVRTIGQSVPKIDRWTVAVLMTHSYSQDLDVLRQLAKDPPSYLGILGPHKRSLQLLSDAEVDAAQLGASLHSPMGLDIGADGPEQVALAVVAGIQAALNNRKGGQLRDRQGAIHAPDDNALDEAGDRSPSWIQSIVCA